MSTARKNKCPSLVASGTIPGSTTSRVWGSNWQGASLTPASCHVLARFSVLCNLQKKEILRCILSASVVMTDWAVHSKLKDFMAETKVFLVNLSKCLHTYLISEISLEASRQSRRKVRGEIKTLASTSVIFLHRTL